MVTINGLEWKLKLGETVGDGLLGLTSFDEPTIYIRYQKNRESMFRTLTHELVHAYLFSYGFTNLDDDKKFSEEFICNFIANNVINILDIKCNAMGELNTLIDEYERMVN